MLHWVTFNNNEAVDRGGNPGVRGREVGVGGAGSGRKGIGKRENVEGRHLEICLPRSGAMRNSDCMEAPVGHNVTHDLLFRTLCKWQTTQHKRLICLE